MRVVSIVDLRRCTCLVGLALLLTAALPFGAFGADDDEVGHEAFVAALAESDVDEMYGMFRPDLQKIIDRPIFEQFILITAEVLGPVKSQGLDDYKPTTEKDGDDVIVVGKNTVTFENGTAEVSTKTFDDELISFYIDAAPVRAVLKKKMLENISALEADESEKFAKYYVPSCTKFLRTLFDDGAEEALDLLDPRVSKQLKAKGEVEVLADLRKRYGKVSKIELETFKVEGTPEAGLQEIKLGFELTRPGKEAAKVECTFGIDGMHAVMIGYSFTEEPKPEGDKKP